MACQQAPGLNQGVAGGAGVGCHPQHQHAFARATAAPGQIALQPGDQACVADQSEVGFGLYPVGQAQHGQGQFALHQLAHRRLGCVPVREKQGVKALVLRQRRDPQRGLGQNAKAAFRAQYQFAQVRPGAGRGQGRDAQRAQRRLQPPAGKQLLDAAIAQRLLAAGARHHPATHGGVLKRLRKVTQRVALCAQLRLHQRPRRARAKGCQLAGFVQVQQPVHTGEIDGQNRPLAYGTIQVPGHTGATSKRDHDPVALLRQVQQLAYLAR